MARGRKVIMRNFRKIWQGLIILVSAFLLSVSPASAEPPGKLVINETDWRTGEIEVSYSGAVPGYTIYMYGRKWNTDYELIDSWVAQAESESRIVQFLENGQTIWFYLVQENPETGERSEPSGRARQTPPITAYIINWPEIFGDLYALLSEMNDKLTSYLDSLFTPSDSAISDLQDAIDNLRDSLGVGAIDNAGGQLQDGLNNVGNNLRPPVVADDGNGTFTGGSNPGQSPFTPGSSSGGGMNLTYPDPDSGTMNEFTIRIPYGVDMNGEFLYFLIFTDEQLEKMKWLGLLRDLAAATIFILFAFWLITRFAPQLKS